MFCPNCGTELEEGTIFCVNCGARLADFEGDPYEPQGYHAEEPVHGGRNPEPYGYEYDEYEEPYAHRTARPAAPPAGNKQLRNGILAAVIIAAAGIAAFFGIRYFMGAGNAPGTQSSANGGVLSPGGLSETGREDTGAGTPLAPTVLTPAPSAGQAPSVAPTAVPMPSATPSAAPTAIPTPTAEPKPTVTSEPKPTVTSEPKPTAKPTPDASSGTNLYVAKPSEGLNIRSLSDYNSSELFTVYGSTPMVFHGDVESGYGSDGKIHDWYQIEVSSVRGWVRRDMVQQLSDGTYVKNTDGALNMRTDHRYSSDLAGTLFQSTPLRYTGESGSGYGSDGQLHDWMLMETAQTITGWVRADLTTK